MLESSLPMTEASPNEVTRLLREIELQTPGAVDQLVNLVYHDLKSMASVRMRTIPPWDTLQPTSLVNEVFVKLFGQSNPTWANRRHFFMAATRAMRDIIIDRARSDLAQKRGGGVRAIALDESMALAEESSSVISVTDALNEFSGLYPRQSEVVELKYYLGLSHDQIAQTMGIARNTVQRDWAFAKVWLTKKLNDEAD